jgi:hypothetical protein
MKMDGGEQNNGLVKTKRARSESGESEPRGPDRQEQMRHMKASSVQGAYAANEDSASSRKAQQDG